ncbi:FAS1-like dehydratase domain-containing protein [Pseudoduganella namucuonensis]|uniref:MaoC like domain-containing protein n=1 Tax=Pseudoduganella namucuonensis TaxID=1035707 RepID=A0A1I7LSA9_9BURK|nr:MaoC family dehydratase N-terminal domain-containing protein [Pseudoduganella namucuonensis]SFV12563.1 MaoC like domain-containing protein [Pseudoduganella namucuonensis]
MSTGTAPAAEFERRLLGMVGREYGPVYAWDEVNRPMIRHWCAATGNRHPAYLDPDSPAARRHGGLVAPPTMLQVWLMPGLEGHPAPDSAEQGPEELMALLARAGYTSSVGVNSEQEYRRYLRPGDRLHCVTTLAAISALKVTALGPGYFVTLALDMRDQDGETVGTMRFRQLVYQPAAAGQAATGDERQARGAAPEGTGRRAPAVAPLAARVAARAAPPATSRSAPPPAMSRSAPPRVGDALPELPIPVTLTGIIAGAIATRDFHPVHHDVAAAQLLGMPTIFMNILTTNACIERHVYEWAGDGAILESVSFKLGTPNFAGDLMTMSGSVRAVDAAGRVELGLRGINARGTHVDAVARLRLV